MRKTAYRIKLSISIILIAILLSSCSKATSAITVINLATGEEKKAGVEDYQKLKAYADDSGRIPLERLLHSLGYQAINQISFENIDGSKHNYFWNEIASETKWLTDGAIEINHESIRPVRITVEPDQQIKSVEFSILDIAPTILSSLSLSGIPDSRTPILFPQKETRVVLILLDAFGYLDFQKAKQQGLIPNLSRLSAPKMGLSVYPPITSVVTAALITGVEPEINGVDQPGKRSTKAVTIFDQLRSENESFSIVEGYSLYLSNLKADDLVLSNDDNQNGTSDDEVFQNAITKMRVSMPEFLWIHFHGIDDTGHTYGPWSPETIQRVQAIDGFVQQLMDASPTNTLFLITADHGMHIGNVGQRTGEHGNLIAEDMLIPLLTYQKP
jgi:hypothetical protein